MAWYLVEHRDNFNLPFTLVTALRLVPMPARSKARTIFNRSNTGIVGSNPDRDRDVCLHFSMLYSPV
jgi:hypothetical protein